MRSSYFDKHKRFSHGCDCCRHSGWIISASYRLKKQQPSGSPNEICQVERPVARLPWNYQFTPLAFETLGPYNHLGLEFMASLGCDIQRFLKTQGRLLSSSNIRAQQSISKRAHSKSQGVRHHSKLSSTLYRIIVVQPLGASFCLLIIINNKNIIITIMQSPFEALSPSWNLISLSQPSNNSADQ